MKPKPLGQTLHCYTQAMAHEVSDVWQFPQQRISLWFLLSSELNCMPCCWSYTRIEREWGKGRMFIQAQTNKTNGGVSNQSHSEFFKSKDFTGKGFNGAVTCTRDGKVVPSSQRLSTWKLSQQDLGQNFCAFSLNKTASPDRNSLKESFLSLLLASWKVGGMTVLCCPYAFYKREIFYPPSDW